MKSTFIFCGVFLVLAALMSPVMTRSTLKLGPLDMEPVKQQLVGELLKSVPLGLKFTSCNQCVAAVSLLEIAKIKGVKESLRTIALKLCNAYEEEVVCQGIMTDYFDAFVDNFFSRYLSSQHICVYLKNCENNTVPVDFQAWKDEVLQGKPAVNENLPVKKSAQFKVLHLTDLHTDLEYSEGSLADCDEPFCCRPESGPTPTDPSKAALYWGTYAKCDVPLHTVEALLVDAKNQMGDIDMIVWTGDNTSHDVWHQQKSNQTLPQAKISELVEKHFPTVAKFPIFGNHECFPADQYDVTQTDQTRWMRVESAQMWKKWLSPASILSLTNHGFYAEYDAKTNVRAIAINTQACDMLNFFLIQNVTNPNGEIEFLRKELQFAETNNQKAFIFGHIPYGDNTCSSLWAERIQVLVNRYENTIIGQFFGHTHNDHIEVIKSVEGEERSVGTVFIAPSGTTYSYHNPSYRIITFENEQIQNIFQYRLNMKNVVQRPEVTPKWELAYDFLSEYGLKDLSNQSLYEFAMVTLPNDKQTLATYMENFTASTETINPTTLTETDKKQYSCLAQNAVFNQKFQCMGLYAFTQADDLLYRAIEFIQGGWYNKAPKSNK